jgi:Domain of unknown function (DUF4279)
MKRSTRGMKIGVLAFFPIRSRIWVALRSDARLEHYDAVRHVGAGQGDARRVKSIHREANSSESNRRFDVELFIVHPTIDPSEITMALGLEPKFSHRVGDPRMTPTGTPIEGNYPDTRWRHSARYTVSHQWFADRVESLVAHLLPHKAFLSRLLQTGGKLTLIVQFLGDGYFGDEIPQSTLAKIADLGLSLGIECFMVPQSD